MNFDEWAKSIFKHGTDAQYGIAKAAWDEATKIERDAHAKICDSYKAESDLDGTYIAELVEQVRKWKLAWRESTDREIELKSRIATLEAELLETRDLL